MTCPGSLAALCFRAYEAEVARRRSDRGRKNASHFIERPIEGQFAESGILGKEIGRHEIHGGKYAECEREVEMAALLEQIRWLQIDQNPSRWQRKTHGMERGSHSLARFRDGLVRESDDQEVRCSAGQLHLNFHGYRINS